MKTYSIQFTDQHHEPVQVLAGQSLADSLHANNSPLLFGCRTGICGTCVVEIHAGAEHTPPADEEEREILELFAADQPHARLACQIDVQGDLLLRPHCQNRWSG